MQSISSRLKEQTITLLDGAMGTELFRRGVKTPLPSWSARALVENPDIVREIHEDYIRAGSEILTTNTFRTTTRALGKVGLGHRAKELTQLAVKLAKQAQTNCADRPVWIAGSVAPLEDCFQPQLMPDFETACREHQELIAWLVEAGVDFILIETMNTISETIAAAQAANTFGIPMLISWTCAPDGKILNGDSLKEAISSLAEYEPAAFLVNCTPVKNIPAALLEMRTATEVPIGAYANIGKAEDIFGWEFTKELGPSAYARQAETWIQRGAKIIGGCCGTTPDHISALRSLIQN